MGFRKRSLPVCWELVWRHYAIGNRDEESQRGRQEYCCSWPRNIQKRFWTVCGRRLFEGWHSLEGQTGHERHFLSQAVNGLWHSCFPHLASRAVGIGHKQPEIACEAALVICNPSRRGSRNFILERGFMRNRFCILVILATFLILPALGFGQATPAQDKATQAKEFVKVGDALLMRKKYEDALVQYLKAQALSPKDAFIANKLGIVYQDLQNFSKAKKSYEQAVKLNPKYVEAWNNLGTVYYLLKNYKKAITQYEKAIEINPQFAVAYNNLGSALFARKKYEEGFKAYLEAYRLDPGIMERASAGAASALKTSTTTEAIQNFYLAKLYAGKGDLEKALLYLAKAQEKGFKEFEKVEKDPDFKEFIKDERYQQMAHPKPQGKQ